MTDGMTEFERAMVRTSVVALWQTQHMTWASKRDALGFTARLLVHLQSAHPYVEGLAEDLYFLCAIARTHANLTKGSPA